MCFPPEMFNTDKEEWESKKNPPHMLGVTPQTTTVRIQLVSAGNMELFT